MQNNNSTSLKRREAAGPEHLQSLESDVYYDDGYYGAGVSEQQSEKQMLLRFLSVLRKFWPLIAAMTLLVTALVVIYEAQKPDYYVANVRIQINNEMNPASGGSGTSSIVMPGNDPGYFSTQLQIIEGSGMLRRVVKTLDLENNEAFLNPLKGRQLSVWQNVQRMFGFYKPVTAANSQSQAEKAKPLDLTVDTTADLDSQAEVLAPYVSMLKAGLTVTPVKDSRTATKETRLIEVEFTHYDPQVATKVVNSIADVYVLQNLERKVESNANAGDFLQKRVAELQAQIRIDEERLINYAKSNQIISLDPGQNTVVQRLSDLHTKLSQAEGERINAETAYRAVLQNPMRETIAEGKDGRTSALESQLSALRQTLLQLKTEFTDEWPEVKKVKGQIAAIEKELQTNKKRSTDTELATLEQAYRQASARENELRAYFASQRQAVLTQNEAAVNYRIIQQEIDTNKGLLESLLKRFRETEVVLNGTPNNVHVVDRALVPRGPDGPKRTKNVVIAFFASLLGGLGLAFLLSWLDDTVRSNDDLELQLGMPVIGLIPTTGNGRKRLLTSKLRRSNGNGNHRIASSYHLENFQKPLVAEAFNQLRTSLLLSNAGGAPQTVLVASGQPFEGKTITSLNLAKSLAQLGDKVLLIDADLRSPKMHLLHNLDNKKGLSSLLTTKTVDDEAVKSTIQREIDLNLDLLTSGPKVPNPSNLFSSPEMRRLLERFSREYTHIVIDSPPILYFADSVILSNCVDAVVIMARANVSSREILLRAKKVLQDVRANIIGIVMNDVPLGSFKYYNNKYYRQLDEPEMEEASAGNMLHLG